MPWAVAAAAVGAAGSYAASSDAARKQGHATDDALAEQQRQYDLSRNDQAPYREAGSAALQKLNGLSDTDPTPDAASVMSQPGYQFGLNQGINSAEGSQAAKGGLYSGAALKALTQYGNDYATTKYQDAFNNAQTSFGNRWNRLAGLAGIGQTATQQGVASGQNYANQTGALMTNNANAQGAAGIAQGNVFGNLANQAGSAAKNYWGAPSGSGASPYNAGVGSNSAGGSPDGYWADGGPVRMEPKIGTKGPVRTGGGGGLSRDAVLAILDAQPATQQPTSAQTLVGQTPTRRPLIPIEVEKKAGTYKNGGPVRGKGGPRSDTIHGMLSPGEHVFRTSAVNALGGGSNAAGQKKLSAMQQLLDGGTNHGG